MSTMSTDTPTPRGGPNLFDEAPRPYTPMTAEQQSEIRRSWQESVNAALPEAEAADPNDVLDPHDGEESDFNVHAADLLAEPQAEYDPAAGILATLQSASDAAGAALAETGADDEQSGIDGLDGAPEEETP